MRTFLVVSVLSLAACAAPNVQRRTPVSGTAPVRAAFDVTKYQGLRASADHSPAAPSTATPTSPNMAPNMAPSGDAPVDPGSSSSGGVSTRSFTVTSETRTQPEPEPEPAPEPFAEPWREPVTAYYQEPAYWYPEPRPREPWIPVNTVVGASFGAAYDATNCGHGHEGVLVGAGIGLVLDLGRLFAR